MNQLISIIVPIYKVEKYLKKCLDSIINQTYSHLEIILVDDGSPDLCPQICDEYARVDDRIVVIHQENKGLSAARNVGIENAKGEYIGFVDSDDYIAPEMYEMLLANIIEYGTDMAICNYEFVDESGRSLLRLSSMKNEKLTNIQALKKFENPQNVYYETAWNKLYNRNIFRNIKFPVGKLNEDTAIMHEIFYQCNSIITLEAKLYYYLQRENSIMSNFCDIRRLDNIEALYKRYSYYKEKELNELLPGIADYIFRAYKYIRWRVIPKTKMDYLRIKEIDEMFYEVFFSKDENNTLVNKIKLMLPGIYCRINNMMIGEKFKKIKRILEYSVQSFGYKNILFEMPIHSIIEQQAIDLEKHKIINERKNDYIELKASDLFYHENIYAAITHKSQNILIHGESFLGILWPDEEYLFRRIVEAFHENKITVFAHKVTFDMTNEVGIKLFEESRTIYSAHPNLTIYFYEIKSYEFMRKYMPDVNVELVSDIISS